MQKRAARRLGKGALVALLALCLSVMMMPAVALGESAAQKEVIARDADQTVIFGDISETSDQNALLVEATNEKKADVTAGNVSSSGNAPTVVVTTINGTDKGGTATVKTGGISNTGTGSGGTAGGTALAAVGGKNGTTSVEVKGNVSSVKQAGVALRAGQGLENRGDNANVNVAVLGNVTSKDNDGAMFTATNYARDACLSLVVEGDVSGGKDGLYVVNTSDTAKTDVLVTGTIKSVGPDFTYGVDVFVSNVDANSLTVWKIEAASGRLVSVESLAKAVNYIVRTTGQAVLSAQATGGDEPAAANWKVSANAAGTEALKTSHGFDVANEDQVIYIVADEGYRIIAASNANDAQTVEKDADGNYFIKVKRGGGIDIQATVEAISTVYKVVFADEDGTVLQTTEEKYGATPAYKGATPTKAADDDYTYAFDAWTPAISQVTKDITYTATYAKTAKEKPAPAPEEKAAETKAASATASTSPLMPQTDDTMPVLPVIATLLLAAVAIGASRAKMQPVRAGKHARR